MRGFGFMLGRETVGRVARVGSAARAGRMGDQCSMLDLEEELVFLGVEAGGGDGSGSVRFVELEESACGVSGKERAFSIGFEPEHEVE